MVGSGRFGTVSLACDVGILCENVCCPKLIEMFAELPFLKTGK
jgi:hypothetical protein